MNSFDIWLGYCFWARVLKITLLIVVLLATHQLIAQSVPTDIDLSFRSPTSSQSSNALGIVGESNISPYTGSPNIQVPLHTVKSGDIEVPISLIYNPQQVKPNNHPGWVGLGWHLSANGAITRTVRGLPDDYYYRSGQPYRIFTIEGGDIQKFHITRKGFYFTYDWLNNPEWDNECALEQYANRVNGSRIAESYCRADNICGKPLPESEWKGNFPDPTYIDTEPDEFAFQFLGYSGKFYLNHERNWVVVADDDIKVELLGLEDNPVSKARDEVKKYLKRSSYFSTKMFQGFRLTTPDGTIYTFGDVKNAVEYSVAFNTINRSAPKWVSRSPLSADTWYLTKIESPRGRKVTFTYKEGPVTSKLQPYYYYHSLEYNTDKGQYNITSKDCFKLPGFEVYYTDPSIESVGVEVSDEGDKAVVFQPDKLPVDGFAIFPVYLEKISYDGMHVAFSSSESKELTYEDQYLKHGLVGWNENEWEEKDSYQDYYKWLQLDNVTLYDQADKRHKKFDFKYTSSAEERLKLLSIQEVGIDQSNKVSIGKPPHRFLYYDDIFPEYLTNQYDHWGYFTNRINNNRNSWSKDKKFSIDNSTKDSYEDLREPNADGNAVQSALLKGIHHPTDGYTHFEYEAHRYSKALKFDRSEITTYNSKFVAGGPRIRSIKTYDYYDVYNNYGKPVTNKSYHYVRTNNPTGSFNGLSGSGIISSEPVYYIEFQRKDYWQNNLSKYKDDNVRFEMFTSQNLGAYGDRGNEPHVVYSEVYEVTEDNDNTTNDGYVRYRYRTYEDRMDDLPKTTLHKSQIYDENDRSKPAYLYAVYTDRSVERGKIASTEYYGGNNALLKEVKYDYTAVGNTSDFIRAVDARTNEYKRYVTYPRVGHVQLSYASSYKIHTYRYLPEIITTKQYGTESGSPLVTQVKYEYTGRNLLREQQITDSKDHVLKTRYYYPTDFPNTTATLQTYYNMVADKHIFNYPIETIHYRDDKVIGANIQTYKLFHGEFYLPYETYSLTLKQPLDNYAGLYVSQSIPTTFRLQQIRKSYDQQGNLLESQGTDGISTSYLWGYQQTLPVAQVVGATLDEVESILGEDFHAGGSSLSETQVTALQNELPEAYVTAYTHDPLKGITSITNPNKRAISYQYDDIGRPYYIKNEEKDVVQKFEYGYTQAIDLEEEPVEPVEPEPEPGCTASLSASIVGGAKASIGYYATFRANVTGCEPFTYRWSTDRGQVDPATSDKAQAQIKWDICGPAEVYLTVTDDKGRNSTITKAIVVDDPTGDGCEGIAPQAKPEEPTLKDN